MESASELNRRAQLPASHAVNFRLGWISLLASGIGIAAGLIAYLLLKLIGLFTNLFFFHRISAEFTSPMTHHLGVWVILLPAAGGIVIGLMAKYGTSKIKGHGIPEAMEAVLTSRSRWRWLSALADLLERRARLSRRGEQSDHWRGNYFT